MSRVVLRASASDGSPLPPARFDSLYLTDLDRNPLRVPATATDGQATVDIAPDQRFCAIMHMPVEGFGRVYLVADNAGDGYAGREGEIDLNVEFARSRLATVTAERDAAETSGCVLSAELRTRLEQAEALLTQAEQPGISRAGQVSLLEQSLAESLWAGEMVVRERAQHDTARRGHREGFLFGCNAFGYPGHGEQYARRFSELLNFATLPFYWASFEPQQGHPGYARTDEMLRWTEQEHISAKGHPLVWFHRAGIPQWIEEKSFDEIRELSRARVHDIVSRYRGRIDIWDVINEAHDWGNELGFSAEQLLEMTRVAAETTRAADPSAVTVVNNCCPFGEYVATQRTYFGPSDRPLRAPIPYLQACLEAGIEFDVVGVQLYYPGYDMLEISRLLDRFAALGKPIHVTELGVSSDSRADPNAHGSHPSSLYWHGPWSESIQADWVEQFYTLCYSKPYIEAITWWDFADKGHFWPHGGFLRPDMTPKESYLRLQALLRGWGFERPPAGS